MRFFSVTTRKLFLKPPIHIVECPRDAMQGLPQFVPTSTKIEYINALISVGFRTIDFGSFVSPKAVPQMSDTSEVLAGLDLSPRHPNWQRPDLLVIVANERGAETAAKFPKINCVGFPLSVSETFQRRNTNASIAEGLKRLETIHRIASSAGQTTVCYLSMAFGNPYGDPISPELVADIAARVISLGIRTISLADTVGTGTPTTIHDNLIAAMAAGAQTSPQIEWGVHLHSNPATTRPKLWAAYRAGIRRFDAAIGGMGGCPFAADKLTGNIPTEELLSWLSEPPSTGTSNSGGLGLDPVRDLGLDLDAFQAACALQRKLFSQSSTQSINNVLKSQEAS